MFYVTKKVLNSETWKSQFTVSLNLDMHYHWFFNYFIIVYFLIRVNSHL